MTIEKDGSENSRGIDHVTSVEGGDSTIEWETAFSMKGVPYEIGRKKNSLTEAKSDEIATAVKNDFGVKVNWPVGDRTWKNPSDDLETTTGITQYSYHSSSHPFYDFVIEIQNSETYNYRFYDETGDSYQINTYNRDDHLVRLKSKRPTIVYITGS